MEIHQLEYLAAVAEEGSVTKAAERLGVAQPSISQQLRKLEREVGQPLFDRLPRGVALTEGGRRMLEHARKILAEVRDARRHVADARQEIAGPLVVGAIPTIAPYVMPRIVKRFLAEHPAAELTIVEDVTQGLVDRLDRGELDLAVASSVEGSPRILVEKVTTEPLWLLVPEGHRLAGRKSVAWPALRRERFLVLHTMHCLAGQVREVCEAEDVVPRIVSRGSQLATIAAMVSTGLGVSIVPEMMRTADARPSCVYVPLSHPAPTRELNLLWSPDRYRSNAARALAQQIRESLRSGDVHAASNWS